MDKVIQLNRFAEIELDFKKKAAAFLDFHYEAANQISDWKMKIIESIVTAIIQSGEVDPYQYDTSNVFDYEHMKSLPSYSRYNPFVWMRICSRKIKQLKRKEGEYHRYFRDLLKEIKLLEAEFQNRSQKQPLKDRLNDMQTLKYKIHLVLSLKLEKEGDFIEPLQLAFFDNWKMSKNNFLSLLSLNHDLCHWDGTKNETMQYIATLPEEIDYNAFQEAVFINRLEHDQDCYLFDVYMDGMLRLLEQNKEMSGKVFDKVQETFGPIPTYTVTTDEFGDITAFTPNKPHLHAVK